MTLPQHLDDTLRYIAACIDSTGYPPTRRDLARLRGGVAPSTAERAVQRLEAQGLITVDHGIARGIRITAAGMKALTEEL